MNEKTWSALTREPKADTIGRNTNLPWERLPFRKEEIEYSIPKRFERIVNRFHGQLALKGSNLQLTYRELDNASNRIAHRILARCRKEEKPVAMLFEHGIYPIIAMFGILKAGKCYVALDPLYPPIRLLEILQDVEPGLIVSNQSHVDLAREVAQNGQQILNIEPLDLHYAADEKMTTSISPDSMAAIFYTSGSTGKPKGVIRDHRTLLHSIWHNTTSYAIYPEDRYSLLYSCSFIASAIDIFDALLNGATLCPYNVKEQGLKALIDWLIEEQITLFHLPVTLLRQLFDTLTRKTISPKIRVLFLGGQNVYKQDIERFQMYFPTDCLLLHRWGTSETSMVAQFFIDRQTEITHNVVPAGYITSDKEISLLDEAGDKLGVNHVGEIAVRSRYLSPGYWNDPELTHQKFLPDPEGGDKRIYRTGDLGRMRPDGCLEFLGRKDFQVKIRGYRVMLPEIEAALYALDSVKEAVVSCEEQHDDPYLVAYVVVSRQSTPAVTELRSALADTLPDYMLPSRFVFLEMFPLTPTGKVDRQALPEPPQTRPELVEPLVVPDTPLATFIAEIWQESLGVDQVGVYDNFFDLGGHSLLMMQVIVRIEKHIGVRLTPREFIYQTLGQIVAVSEEQMALSRNSEPKGFFRKWWNALKNRVLQRSEVRR